MMIGAACLEGTIIHHADVDQKPGQDPGDSKTVTGVGVIIQDIFAQIPKSGNTEATAVAYAAVGLFGSVGLIAKDFSPTNSITHAEVDISSDEFTNDTSWPQEIFSSVVVDGGALRIPVGTPDSQILYEYHLFSDQTNTELCSIGVLNTDSLGKATFDPHVIPPPQDVCGGGQFVDLGATFDEASGLVTIPLSFHKFDLGKLPAGKSMEIQYSLGFAVIHGAVKRGGTAAELDAQFSDPFRLSGHPALGTITFEPVEGAIPEPGMLMLLGCGLLGLGIAGRYNRAVGSWRIAKNSIKRIPSRVRCYLTDADVVSGSHPRCRSLALLLSLAALLAVSPANAANITVNPGFETGDFSGWTTHACSTCFGTGWFIDTNFQHSGTFDAAARCAGAACLDPVSGNWLSQALPTTPGQMYTLTLWLNPGYNNGPGSGTELDVRWDGLLVLSAQNPPTFQELQITIPDLRANSSTTILQFLAEQPAALWIDDIDPQPVASASVPEPMTTALTGFGLLLVGVLRRRARGA